MGTGTLQLNGLERLHAGAEAFGELSVHGRAELVARLRSSVMAAAEEWVAVCCEAKGIGPGSAAAAEEWLGGPVAVLRYLRLVGESLERIAKTKRPPFKMSNITHRGPNLALRVLPENLWDKLIFRGYEAEVWMRLGMDETRLEAAAAARYLGGEARRGAVRAVLGAGNFSSIGPLDALGALFVDGDVVALKLHPVNAYLAPVFERAFGELIDAGYLALFDPEREVGEALVQDERVSAVHLTGSGDAFDSIVWGDGVEAAANRSIGRPVLDKPITAELGCVTPILVVPGIWTSAEIEFQARNVAAMVTNNASFNCNAAKLLLTAERWPQRRAFVDAVAQALEGTPTRDAYYPGAAERYAEYRASAERGGARVVELGNPAAGQLPWLLARDLPFEAEERGVFEREAWCSVLAEATLNAGNASEFIPAAVTAVNERVFGTLSCCVLVDPRTAAEPGPKSALSRAERDLEYGAIAINHWPALAYALGTTTWGAFPGHTLAEPGSGLGVVHNARMLPDVLKSIVRGPFLPGAVPPWVVRHARALETARALAAFEAQPGLGSAFELYRQSRKG